MRYSEKKFTVGATTKDAAKNYSDNYDAIFKKIGHPFWPPPDVAKFLDAKYLNASNTDSNICAHRYESYDEQGRKHIDFCGKPKDEHVDIDNLPADYQSRIKERVDRLEPVEDAEGNDPDLP